MSDDSSDNNGAAEESKHHNTGIKSKASNSFDNSKGDIVINRSADNNNTRTSMTAKS